MFYLPGLLIGKTKDITPVDGGEAGRAWAWAWVGAGVGGYEPTLVTEPGFGLRGAEVWKKKIMKIQNNDCSIFKNYEQMRNDYSVFS